MGERGWFRVLGFVSLGRCFKIGFCYVFKLGVVFFYLSKVFVVGDEVRICL